MTTTIDFESISVFALIIAVYGAITVIGSQAISTEGKKDLVDWLKGLKENTNYSNDQWAISFCQIFDSVFGNIFYSLKFILKSVCISVSMLVLAFPILDTLGINDYENGIISTKHMLVIALVVNVICDYISLLETRLLLNLFSRFTQMWQHLILLIMDTVFTTAIFALGFWIATFLVAEKLLGLQNYLPLAWEIATIREILSGEFSPYFYTTFFTSVWVWGYFFSTWFIRVFATGRLDILIVNDKPERIIAFVICGFLFFLLLIIYLLVFYLS